VILAWLFLIARLTIWGIGLNVAIWERFGPGPVPEVPETAAGSGGPTAGVS
jgi:hypothetical protein